MLDNWKDLIRPKLDIRALDDRYGRFDLEPFERGFGTTIGNALRRVLLSSLKALRSRTCGSTACCTSSRRSTA